MLPDFDEEAAKLKLKKLAIKDRAMALAVGKALSISKKFPTAYVIGSDQICELNKEELSKSKSIADCIKKLTKLSGATHYQNNATVVAHQNKIIYRKFTKVELTMRDLTKSQIKSYVAADLPLNSAGAYKYESFGKHLFSKVNGSYYAILGFDLEPLISFLHQQNIISIS